MRILHVVTAFPRAPGDVIAPWLVELLKRLQSAGHAVEVFTSAYRGGGGTSFDGIPVHRFRYFPARWEDLTHDEATPDRMRRSLLYRVLPFFYILGGVIGIWRLARRRSYDVIHVHWPVPHMVFGWVGRLASGRRARLASTWYGVELRWVQSSLPWLRGFVRWALRRSDAVIAISSYTAGEIERFARVPVRVIPYTLGFAPPAGPRPPRPAGTLRILFVGRLVERKGVSHLVRAVRLLPDDLDARLTIIGDGPERTALEAQIARERLEDRVTLAGRVAESALRAAYSDADVLVLPSIVDARGDTEGLGVVLLEAMSYGVPVIGSNLGGITDIISDGATGLLVPAGDPDQLAAALARLARDPALASRLGAAGEARVRQAFGWPEIMARWQDLYGALAKTRIDTATAGATAATRSREEVR